MTGPEISVAQTGGAPHREPGLDRSGPLDPWARRALEELCAVDTTTGLEGRALPILESLLESAPHLRVMPVDGERANIFASWVPPEEVAVLLTTHLDTVPPFVAPVRSTTGLVGRGTCDAKGQIVAQLGALRALMERGERRVAWLGLVGEETDGCGARAAVEVLAAQLPSLRAIVNGEPTDSKLPRGQKGFLHLEISCRGQRAHGSDPVAADARSGHSALWRLHDWLESLRDLSAEDADFGCEVWNLGLVRGGEAANVVAGEARAEIVVRTVPGSHFLHSCRLRAPAGGTVRVLADEPPLLFGREPKGFEGSRAAAVGFGSDAPELSKLLEGGPSSGQIFLFGPGTIDRAHTDHEFLDWKELSEGIDALARLCGELASGPFQAELPSAPARLRGAS